MKPLLAALLVLLFIAACEKEEKTSNTHLSNGTKLLEIIYNPSQPNRIERYSYAADGRISTVEQTSHGEERRYEMNYQSDQLKEIYVFQVETEKLLKRDSLAYDDDQNLQAVYFFFPDTTNGLSLEAKVEYEYDDQGELSMSEHCYLTPPTHCWTKRYYWSDNNITRIEHFYENEALSYEVLMEYDDKVNYLKDLPNRLVDTRTLSKNNILSKRYIDYTGLLDVACNPCISSYVYNLDGYPVFITSHFSDNSVQIRYE